ncbi:Glycoside hydrolase, family 63 [Gemmatirosa kalamazoonensis]|uniref:Glycoside hydrolase, family 63 n=1 Tax=Gemmatirosa kalamazoonensis TaxID=861299 RepID=W0RM80_9BACT|nr:glucosidase [Gemmatirosa kalamazoonensis]AHG91420.1 Glycoside hydrolase, family 63 [Gemmatirosa kalamazoonensis]
MDHAEALRLSEDARRTRYWKRWGPYLSERQWGTVREDYSEFGTCWEYFPHDHARSRAYRWGEDGLFGIADRQCRLCFALALWNGRDPILKERLFGLTGNEGNHGEDVKECYYYLDATPTSSYLKALYKYPQAEFPYARLLEESRRRGKLDPEFELIDSGVFDEGRYFDVLAEYAKESPDDVLVRLTVTNRGPDSAPLHLLPTLWFRNTWSWGRTGEQYGPKPSMHGHEPARIVADHHMLGQFVLTGADASDGTHPTTLFTENDSNTARLWDTPNAGPVKDAFHEYVVNGRLGAVSPKPRGTKAALYYPLVVPARASVTVTLRLHPMDDDTDPDVARGSAFDATFTRRIAEADEFYASRLPAALTAEEHRVARQAYAGLLWSKQFYFYVVAEWLDGDPAQPPPPPARKRGRNANWRHVYNADVVSMPDKWEYPWYAAWDLAFHTLPLARIDPDFAKHQLILFLREWYMHPNGQIPAYEFAFGDVNPPVHAWAVWRVYKMTGQRGKRDRDFLERAFHKLLVNFTWWVNRKDPEGNNLFAGGFLGLDNIGVFDRSKPLPTAGELVQADGTAWMAFFCATMLSIALELASEDPAYDDVASKFFEHFVAITDAMNTLGDSGLWDERDGFYYDEIHLDGKEYPLRVRSLVGLIPLIAVEILEQRVMDRLPAFSKRMRWFVENRPDLAHYISYVEQPTHDGATRTQRLLAIPSRERLERVLRYLLDESEFLSDFGVRSVSRVHKEHPYVFHADGDSLTVAYDPAESTTGLFGGNSNWRGPIWFPVNYLLVEALERYAHFYGDSLRVECPVGSGRMLTLDEVATELSARLARIFLPDASGRRPCHGDDPRYATDPAWRDLVLFHEYFHGDTGRGIGASHQTGWTALVVRCLETVAQARTAARHDGAHSLTITDMFAIPTGTPAEP